MTTRATRIATVSLIAALIPSALIAPAHGHVDPALQQHVDANERHAPAGESATLTAGHADIGPTITDDGGARTMSLKVRDDHAQPPVWRELSDVTVNVPDHAAITLPDDRAYDFTGGEAGKPVWVLPQTEATDVPWLGWNTQHPGLIESGAQGVTLSLTQVEGPGQFSLFLQNGGFEAPQVLWNSAENLPQDLWVDMNTHTHANWVFSAPGTYELTVTATATGADGTEYSATAPLRFEVGSEQARAEYTPASSTTWLYIVAAAVIIAVLVGAAVAVRRRRSAGGERA
ncbi:choice-of-anchor M domain-containing protein [Corynebacterium renale]|uniref:Surface-anchored protein n=1 Tax=Corynebacterium renale TaxID=1724 RepID=A0A2A9DMW1_9CORY|nr:choice-of-anchor M domain-containing protein [Corynebacterium renale]PFG27260.1 surface-anchored protein [Corynebacterium renale]SQI23654.1 putative secreted protein [Corynebacterium renale]